MLPTDLEQRLQEILDGVEHPREMVVDVMVMLQEHFGYLTDEAVQHAARLTAMSPLEVEELATFYTFVYRESVGRYVIHVCDSLVCWLDGYEPLRDYLCKTLGIELGRTTPDGLFTLLPVCCIGYCDRAPAILVNRKVYGNLTPAKIDTLIDQLRHDAVSG
jgi:NADH-quinone oxidoreductase subunit E